MRNYDLMTDKRIASLNGGDADPFVITTCDILGFNLFKHYEYFHSLGQKHTDAINRCRTKIKNQEAWGRGENTLPGTSRTVTGNLKFLRNMSLGVLAGVAIIVPMLVVALVNDLVASLVVTCVATVLFAVVLALPLVGGNLDEQTILGAVAAYAAILVVFVGTSLSVTST